MRTLWMSTSIYIIKAHNCRQTFSEKRFVKDRKRHFLKKSHFQFFDSTFVLFRKKDTLFVIKNCGDDKQKLKNVVMLTAFMSNHWVLQKPV